MSKPPALDPFTVFGIEHRLDLDDRALERRYLQLSRECHPDLHRAERTADCAAVLARAAEINDSWRVLKDRWERARALIELQAPGALDAQKQLDPEFLAEALELAEEVAMAAPDALEALRARLRARADAAFAALRQATVDGDLQQAARRLHESKYVRKALADLQARAQEARA
ncbi:MAG: Fe-S protein assembly co-chaperone HscB [Planctomycetota bacterium]